MTVEVLIPRDVPLGGLRDMRVRRTLPQRGRSLIGPWCFLDHYGPDDVAETGGMLVPPHPHTGLQTVSWLFTGAVAHRDSLGTEMVVRPGELNLMTSGHGISHSEVSTGGTTMLHGVQLWLALPSDAAGNRPAFQHYVPPRVGGAGWQGRVFMGTAFGNESPVPTYSPTVGAEAVMEAGTTIRPELREGYECGILVDFGLVTVNGQEVKPHELAFVGSVDGLEITAHEGSRVLLVGGAPFGEEIVMWWNFVGRTHEDIEQARADWQAQVATNGPDGLAGAGVQDGRFGVVPGDLGPIPAPELPKLRLKPRR